MVRKTKQCSKCKQRKSLFEFSKHSQSKNGLRPDCKDCMNDHARKYRQTHKTEIAERNKKYYHTDKGQQCYKKSRQRRKVKLAKCLRDYRRTIKGCLGGRFQSMKRRCNNSKDPDYKNYGGRGIKCLFKSSQKFADYVINELQVDPRGLTIDRIDNNGHYEPGNIRFVTMKVNANNRRKKMNKRLITPQQETVLKLVHHDFQGLSQSETAKRLSISQSTVSKILKQIEKVMPQFFPILTKLEARIYHHYMTESWSVDEIAEHLGLTPNSVYKTLRRTKDKGMYFTDAKGRILQYDPSMDANIKQQF